MENTLIERKKFINKHLQTINLTEIVKMLADVELSGGNAYSALTRSNIVQAQYGITPNDFREFCKYIYDRWYEYYTSYEMLYVHKKNIIDLRQRLLSDSKCYPQNVTPDIAYKIFFDKKRGFLLPNEFSPAIDASLLPIASQNDIEPINSNNIDADLIHTFPFGRNKEELRLYVNLTPSNALKVSKILTENCFRDNKKIYYKFCTRENIRNDGFLIYTNYNDANYMVDLLTKIREENPELFWGAENINPLMCKINDFIGYGEEPLYKLTSFNSERADAIDELYTSLIAQELMTIGNFSGSLQNRYGDCLNLKQYLIYRLSESFINTLNQRQKDIKNNNYPSFYVANGTEDSYKRIETEIYRLCKNGLPEQVVKQIEIEAQKIINSLKRGNRPNKSIIKFLINDDNHTKYDKKITKQQKIGKNNLTPYYVPIDLDICAKFFEIFGSKARILSQINPQLIKMYFEKHHICVDYPYLNIESQRCINQQTNNNFFSE